MASKWMQYRRRILYGSIIFAVAVCGMFFYVLTLGGDCCAIPPTVTPDSRQALQDDIQFTGKLVFESDPVDFSGHFTGIAVLETDSSVNQKLTDDLGGGNMEGYRVGSPSWSHDGEQIVFVGYGENNRANGIFMMNADGSDLHVVMESEEGDYSSPSLSPDGTQLLYGFRMDSEDDIELYLFDLEVAEETPITTNNVIDSSPTWSPDGEWIAFHREIDDDFEIFMMRSDGSEELQLTDNETRDVYPEWSPDGSQIAFVSDRSGENAMYIMDVEDQATTFVMEFSLIISGRLAWSPDGEWIAFAAPVPDENVSEDIITHPVTTLYVVRIADGHVELLLNQARGLHINADWVK